MLVEICNEQKKSVHSNLHLGKMFEVSAPIIASNLPQDTKIYQYAREQNV